MDEKCFKLVEFILEDKVPLPGEPVPTLRRERRGG